MGLKPAWLLLAMEASCAPMNSHASFLLRVSNIAFSTSTNLPDADTIELDKALEDVVSNVAGFESAQLLGMMSPSLFDRSCRRRARRIFFKCRRSA
ncbi:unnamed protein product [Sphacelaria rigidula]